MEGSACGSSCEGTPDPQRSMLGHVMVSSADAALAGKILDELFKNSPAKSPVDPEEWLGERTCCKPQYPLVN